MNAVTSLDIKTNTWSGYFDPHGFSRSFFQSLFRVAELIVKYVYFSQKNAFQVLISAVHLRKSSRMWLI
jgi:hypothetical protein